MQVRGATAALFVFLLPVFVFAGEPFNKSNAGCTQQDSIVSISPTQVEVTSIPTRKSPPVPPDDPKQNAEKYDYRKDGLFLGLFHVGVNFAQIDGDAYWGYNKPGLDAGVGTMVRVSRHFAPSIELNYAMWGAQATFFERSGDSYKTNLNYVQVPIAINVLDKEIIMFSAGINLGYLAAFKENDTIITNVVQQPKSFDLDGFLAFHVIVKKQFAIGLKFSYSLIPFRPIEPGLLGMYTHITSGEYNNVVTLRFMYILKATTFKKKR